MVQWLALSPHSKKVLGPSQDVSVWSLHVLPVSVWVYSGYSSFLPQRRGGGRLIGYSKLPVGVSVNGCSSLR